jgi:Family of unknown function (DUF6424)
VSPRSVPPAGVHPESGENPWTVNIVDHPSRGDSRWFVAAKACADKILATLDRGSYPYGGPPWEMHHGGSLWVHSASGWRMFLARAGIEWSMQFCADPAKVDRLRQDAQDLMSAYPTTVAALEALGYGDAQAILSEPVVDADTIARYTDSIFNSCVPLGSGDHQGVLPRAAGEHHYPIPVKAGDFIRHDDFVLWVTLADGTHAAVTPVGRRGSGDGRVRLVYARPGTAAADALLAAQRGGRAVILPADHPVAEQAFRHQRG